MSSSSRHLQKRGCRSATRSDRGGERWGALPPRTAVAAVMAGWAIGQSRELLPGPDAPTGGRRSRDAPRARDRAQRQWAAVKVRSRLSRGSSQPPCHSPPKRSCLDKHLRGRFRLKQAVFEPWMWLEGVAKAAEGWGSCAKHSEAVNNRLKALAPRPWETVVMPIDGHAIRVFLPCGRSRSPRGLLLLLMKAVGL